MSKGDIEFYLANRVLALARTYLRKGLDWEKVSYRTRAKHLDRAIDTLHKELQ